MVTSFTDWERIVCFLNILGLNVYERHEALGKRACLVESLWSSPASPTKASENKQSTCLKNLGGVPKPPC